MTLHFRIYALILLTAVLPCVSTSLKLLIPIHASITVLPQVTLAPESNLNTDRPRLPSGRPALGSSRAMRSGRRGAWAPVGLRGAAAAAPGLPGILGLGGVREMHVHYHGPENRRGRRSQHSEQQGARAPWELGFDGIPTAVPGHDQQKAQYITYPSKR
ncbi:MAG: hypothetical protein FRX48_06584 [Lasallia pustulata]|uniref:Uncharacterized protein n=1 Tax=Lasallia pustulata TaxID=136370 RepID=A0A5M8PLT0_9LECA|nr:MAG: hypothetical protein FRX48_06584 [Lasallia pustulata]